MHYPDTPTADLTNPAKPQYTAGSEQLGVQPTIVTPEHLNDITNNLMALVLAAGIAPTKLREADVADAVARIVGGRDATRARLVKDVAGGVAEIALSDAEAGAWHVKLTGARTGDLLLTWPDAWSGPRWVWNPGTGGWAVKARTSIQDAGTAVTLPAGRWSLLLLDGGAAAFITSAVGDGVSSGSPIEQGLHTIWLPCTAFEPAAGAEFVNLTTTVAGMPYTVLAFDPVAAEGAYASLGMPNSWDGGVLLAEVVWMHPDTAGPTGVVWAMQSRSYAAGETLDAGMAAVASTNAAGGVAETSYVTLPIEFTADGTPAGGEQLRLYLRRLAADAADTLPTDAHLLGVRLRYTVAAATDL